MRKGSTSLGSLGLIPSGILLLMLPILAVGLGAFLAPTSAGAAEGTGLSMGEARAVREALDQRVQHLRLRAAVVNPRKSTVVKTIKTRATWYGPGFHGRRTASGEIFNRHAMTLASRHLPLGTRVRVINPKTGKAVEARVNDRGPFGHRDITADLSQGLARRIGFQGTGAIRLEILKKHR